MRLILTLLLFVLVRLCEAASVDGPTQVDPSTPAVFTIRDVPAEHLDKFNWQVFGKPDDAMVLDLADRSGNPVLMFWCKTPGRYAVIADVNVPPDQFELIIHEFTVGQPKPNPGPHPDPRPDPPPEPTAVFGVIIEERSDRTKLTPQRAMVFENKSIRDLFAAGAFHVRDDDVKNEDGQTPADMKPYIDRARKLGLPVLFLVNASGDVLFEGAVPDDVPETVKLIGKYVEVQP